MTMTARVWLLAQLRAIVGPHVPIVASLDLHANVTRRMLEQADALVAYRTYPHEDMAEAGERAAGLLKTLLASGARLHRAARRLPFLIPHQRHVHHGRTGARRLSGLGDGRGLVRMWRCPSRPDFRRPIFPSAAVWSGAMAATRVLKLPWKDWRAISPAAKASG